ncbi:hypothetical protein BGZ96_007494 [Linnemannia gamsii]|uniref:Uncharacterized protein n=1 Tax=Linnemannia gamsii TaxID=64522 RepID=A0ABQ7K0Y5_9FUNG|nr:hypothetical protein BGZ96_007494 [Linnemannia gamsii]
MRGTKRSNSTNHLVFARCYGFEDRTQSLLNCGPQIIPDLDLGADRAKLCQTILNFQSKVRFLPILEPLRDRPDSVVESMLYVHQEKSLQQHEVIAAKLPYPLWNHLPLPTSSLILTRVHNIPPLEYDLHRIHVQRLEQSIQAVYIPPMAKPSLKAKDEDMFR